MRLRLTTQILDGKYKATITLDQFTNPEKSQQILFGEPSFNLGGRFFKEAIKGTITAITQASDAVITASGHNLSVGDVVTFTGINGMVELNNVKETITAVTKRISKTTLVSNGSSYTNGTYTNVSLTGGSGTGAAATILIAGGEVESYTITNKGVDYAVDDFLSIDPPNDGPGSGFQIKVSEIEGHTFTIATDSTSFSEYISGGMAQKDPEISFNLEPLYYSVDTEKDEFTYSREFSVTADTPYPGLASALFCTRNQEVIESAIETWKALSNADLIDITETI